MYTVKNNLTKHCVVCHLSVALVFSFALEASFFLLVPIYFPYPGEHCVVFVNGISSDQCTQPAFDKINAVVAV